MSLKRRQKRLYVYLANVWRGSDFTVDPDTKRPVPGAYIKIASRQHCYLWETPETTEPAPQGKTKVVNIFTLDQWHFEAAVSIEDTDFIEFLGFDTTHPEYPGAQHPDAGAWWVVEGNPQTVVGTKHRPANYRQVYAKRALKPAGVA